MSSSHDLSPLTFLKLFSEDEHGFGMGNPLVGYLMENSLYRILFETLSNIQMQNNFTFWNFRSLRQFVLWLAKLEVRKTKLLSIDDPKTVAEQLRTGHSITLNEIQIYV